jgi:hypothetical protein
MVSGPVGINTESPDGVLHAMGRINLHESGAGGGQNRFTGVNASGDANGRAQFIMSSAYSDLVIASSQGNDVHGSTLTFAAYNPSNAADHRKFVINQGGWGNRFGFLEFGYTPSNSLNPHDAITEANSVMTLDGVNKRLGLGTRNPSEKLDVAGNIRTSGGLIVEGSINSGGYELSSEYIAGGTNIILKGDSVGRSGIFFQSERDGTNINHTSDFGYIQFFSYGADGTTGESNELIIGTSNDSDDHLIFNTPVNNGVRFRIGASATEYKVYTEANLGFSVVGTTLNITTAL